MIAALNHPQVMQILSEATEKIVEGELEHLQCKRKITTSKLTYLNVIGAKTAKLFSVSAELGALLSGNNSAMNTMREFGHHLGIIFQIMDDILDIHTTESLGKPGGQDILEGKPTLPLIIAYTKSTPEEQAIMSERFADPNTTLQDLMPYIEKTNAINDALQEAHAASLLAENCLNMLPDTPYKQALYDLVTFAISRTH